MISSLRLQNFRSYKDESFEFEPGVNIVVGPNASGKTNLLEAVLVLARTKSYRVKDQELIRFGQAWARLDGFFASQERVIKYVSSEEDRVTKTISVEGREYSRLPFDKLLPVVVFEPNDLQLLIRGPEQRREYLDNLLQQNHQHYKALKNNYLRVLSQRNALLKREAVVADELFVWNLRLSELGGQIAALRQSLIDQANKRLSDIYSQIAQQKIKLKLTYKTPFEIDNYTSQLLKKLESSTQLDFRRGFTAYGPHRDDMEFSLNNQAAEHTASRGETRTILLALKILELEILEGTRVIRPLFLLDDVFSELDSSRRRFLVDFLKSQQAIITTTDADAVIEHFAEYHNLIPIQKNT